MSHESKHSISTIFALGLRRRRVLKIPWTDPRNTLDGLKNVRKHKEILSEAMGLRYKVWKSDFLREAVGFRS